MAYDLIVIGGGLVGGAIAWGAAAKGASVALLDQGDIAFRAARGNFGLVWVQSKGAGMPAYAHWTRTSSELWPELAGAMASATGIDVALRQPRRVRVLPQRRGIGRPRRAAAPHAQRKRRHRHAHAGPRRGPRDGAGPGRSRGRRIVLSDRWPRHIRSICCAHCMPRCCNMAARTCPAARSMRSMPRRTTSPSALAPNASPRKLVIAAGLGSRDLAPMVGLSMPVTPLRGQIIVTERLRPFLDYATTCCRQTVEGSVMLGD